MSSNDDVIIDDEDYVVLSEKLELNENPKKQICLEIDESINGPNKVKRSVFPIIELDKLFVCKECGKYSVKLFLIFNKYKFTQLECLSYRQTFLKWRFIPHTSKSMSLF